MRTTTDPKNWNFTFSITDIALLLGKSPVTLRSWETKGFYVFPRDGRGDRFLDTNGIRDIAKLARDNSRISQHRLDLINSAMTMLEILQQEIGK